jgi:aspartate aminotransferase
VYVVSDEIYEKILYDGAEHASIGSLHPDIPEWTITVNGFSKAFSMTGWRLGYVAAPEFLVKAMSALQSHSTSGPNTFSQYGALAALEGSLDDVQTMVQAFAERRAFLAGRLESIKGISCARPMGAFYAFPNISRFGIDDITFAQRLLDEQKVAVIPGSPFGAPSNIRMSYACGMAEIEEGLDRIETFVKGM